MSSEKPRGRPSHLVDIMLPPTIAPSGSGSASAGQGTNFTPTQLLGTLPDAGPPSMHELFNTISPSARPAHSSSKTNEGFEAIDPGSLVRVSDGQILKFRKFLNSMSETVSFNSPLKLPFQASSLTTEGDVTTFIESQVIIASWETVLNMVPPEERKYDLLTVRRLYLESGVPDQVFGYVAASAAEDKHKFNPCAVIEIKSPDIVQNIVSVIANRVMGKRAPASDDWSAVTKQLRKYAVCLSIRDVILIDQCNAVYIHFDKEMSSSNHPTQYLLSTPPDAAYQDPAGFTLRELVAFMCWRALRKKGINLQRFDEKGKGKAPSSEGYSDVLMQPDSPNPRKRLREDKDEEKEVEPKRSLRSGTVYATPLFSSWAVGTSVTLEMVTMLCHNTGFEKFSASSRKTSESFRLARPPIGLTTPTSISAPTRADFTVIRTITSQVAVLSNNPRDRRLFIAKLYAPNPSAPKLMETEINVYKACTTLQGREIPHFYGIWRLIDPLNLFSPVLLIEYIDPGITIDNVRDTIKLAKPYERDEAINRLISLRPSGEKALRALHQSAVCHNDACGRNMVLSADCNGDETVVILDFDIAKVFSDPEKCKKKEWEDWMRFDAAFWVDESEERKVRAN